MIVLIVILGVLGLLLENRGLSRTSKEANDDSFF
jgi:hypothetical protein